MADSEDEYDRKRRDKFRGERAEANYRGADRPIRPRDDWVERDAWQRPRPREYGGRIRERGYSPNYEPATKRMRGDYYADTYFNHYQPYHQQAPHTREQPPAAVEGQQPPMMSFKAFLATQDDNISDNEAIEKYNDYKLEFHRQQLNEFFVAHKDEEWFRLKYHPDDSVKRKEELQNYIKKRVAVFLDLFNVGAFDKYSLDHGHDEELIKLLDTIVIKLEDGTDADFALLEQEYRDSVKYKSSALSRNDAKEHVDSLATVKPEETVNLTTPEYADAMEQEQEPPTTEKSDDDGKTNGGGGDGNANNTDVAPKTDCVNNDSNDEMDTDEPPKSKIDRTDFPSHESEGMEHTEGNVSVAAAADETDNVNAAQVKEVREKRKRSYSGSSSSSSSSSSDSGEEVDQKIEASAGEEPVADQEVVQVQSNSEEVSKPRYIYKTTSICLRNLAPTITKQDIETMCARYDGFLRLALAEPQPDRRWLRRGWLTFKRDANIKEICWHFNNIRLGDFDLGAIINKDLSKRIRYVSGITAHKQVVRSDIRLAAKVVLHLDAKAGLWDDGCPAGAVQPSFGLMSNNPVLHNITDYLIEECSAEEEALLGLEPAADASDSSAIVERDDELIKVLDRIILYLRIVHSIDYYNHSEYPSEDEMPNRCGILHARGPAPSTKTDISQYIGATVEAKMASYLPDKPQKEDLLKNEARLVGLALKDVNTETDKFVQANTRELAKDKWLCPLSGKKFKGPDFVRKHIYNKHAEKIDEVKKEVEFFNNYLRDAKRPMLPEAPQPKREEAPSYAQQSSYAGGYGGYGYGPPAARFNMYAQRPRGFAPRARGGMGPMDHRPVVHYRDLDAPREPEEFI